MESALRYSPKLMQTSPEISGDIKSFLEQNLPKLVMSPSSSYLISSLKLFHSITTLQFPFEDIWQSTIDGLMPVAQSADKIAAVFALVSEQAASTLCHSTPALQDYLVGSAMEAVGGSSDAWPLFENAIAHNALTTTSEHDLLKRVISQMDPGRQTVDGCFRAIEMISQKRPGFMSNESDIHVALISKLLALTELSDVGVSSRANRLRTSIKAATASENSTERIESPLLRIIQVNLETASPQSLS